MYITSSRPVSHRQKNRICRRYILICVQFCMLLMCVPQHKIKVPGADTLCGKVKPICPLCIWCFDSFNSPLRHFMAPVAFFLYIILLNIRSFVELTRVTVRNFNMLVTMHTKHIIVYKMFRTKYIFVCVYGVCSVYLLHTSHWYVKFSRVKYLVFGTSNISVFIPESKFVLSEIVLSILIVLGSSSSYSPNVLNRT